MEISKKKMIFAVLLTMLFVGNGAALVPLVEAEGPIVGRGTFTSSFWVISPPKFGPAEYYGFPVNLFYTIIVQWNSKTYPNGDVRQTLTARGTVEIYAATDMTTPFDIKRCSTALNFFDKGADACDGSPDGFYTVDWDSLEDMERLHHLEGLHGVFIRQAWVRNGEGFGRAIAFTNPPTILIVSE